MRIVHLGVASAMLSTMMGLTPTNAAEHVDLVLHVHRPGMVAASSVTAQSLSGATGTAVGGPTSDGFGHIHEFQFIGEADDAYLGFSLGNDSVLGDSLRWVRAEDGLAEAWLVDGDPRAYSEPVALAADTVVERGGKQYMAVEDMGSLLGLTHSYGQNGYVFDGRAARTLDVLTIYRNRDYFEIAIDINRMSYNMTGNMTGAFLNPQSFHDIDGFRSDGRYYLSFGSMERIFQIRTLTIDGTHHVLHPQDVAHDGLIEVDPATAGFDPAGLADLDAYMDAQVDAGFSGAAVIVTRNGQVVKNSAWGDALKYSTSTVDGETQDAVLLPEDERVPVTTDTLFDLASNSKMYAANYAIQRLVSQDRLDIDATLQSMPGWECFTDESSVYTGKWTKGGSGGIPANAPVGKETVTIRNILTHYGGMIPDPEYPNLTSAGELYYQTDDHTDRAGIVEKICQTPLRYTPRTVYAYSDVDYMILGLLVEQITGQPLDEYLEEEFYGPLGLTDTMFNPLANGVPADRIAATELNGNTRDGNISFGTHADGTPVHMRDYTLVGEVHDEKAWYSMAGVAGHAGLFSTTGDMAVLTQLMLNDGIYGGNQYFTAEVIDEFTTPWAPPGGNLPGSTTGLGWRVHSQNAAAYYYFNWGPSRETFGHQGWTGTLTVIDPLHDITITTLTNLRHSPVVSPPNGFAAAQLAMGNLVPVNAFVYKALTTDTISSRTVEASLSVDPGRAPAGRSVDVAGENFGASEAVTVTATHSGGEIVALGSVTTDANGSLDAAVSLAPDMAPGLYTVTAVGDSSDRFASAALTVTKGSVIDGVVAPEAIEGVPYEMTISGGDGASFTATGLPPGLEINPNTGLISGTPTATGDFTATVVVTDSDGNRATIRVEISVVPQPKPDPDMDPERTAPYLVPGYHELNGRRWLTKCEPYSQTERCTTEIWATKIVEKDGEWTFENGWAFNNLSYVHSPRELWKDNPLGGLGKVGFNQTWPGEDGRAWRTECDTAATGRGACRSYIQATFMEAEQTGSGWKFTQKTDWLFNNVVYFTPGS